MYILRRHADLNSKYSDKEIIHYETYIICGDLSVTYDYDLLLPIEINAHLFIKNRHVLNLRIYV